MSHYIVAKITITDRDRYSQYEAGFVEIFNRYQGRVLAVDETPTTLEGHWECTRTVLCEFPSAEAAMAWYRCADYQALAQHRFAASTGDIAMIAGFDTTPKHS